MQVNIALSKKEAMARLGANAKLRCYFECRPNTGFTHQVFLERQSIVDEIGKTTVSVYESGATAQSRNTGIYFGFNHHVHGPGLLFVETKPECRLTVQQLEESLERGYGINLFSSV